jgi:TPR repeat protein
MMVPESRVAQMDRQLQLIRQHLSQSGDANSSFNVGVSPRLQRIRDQVANAPDNSKDVEAFRVAAELGDSAAMRKLGTCYLSGWNIQQDPGEAEKWYRRSVELGDVKTIYNLGVLFFDAKNFEESLKWFRQAVDLGMPEAMSALGSLYSSGNGVEKNLTEAVEWYRRGAELGEATAMSHLGFCYQVAQGVTQDGPQAVKWYRQAAGLCNACAM